MQQHSQVEFVWPSSCSVPLRYSVEPTDCRNLPGAFYDGLRMYFADNNTILHDKRHTRINEVKDCDFDEIFSDKWRGSGFVWSILYYQHNELSLCGRSVHPWCEYLPRSLLFADVVSYTHNTSYALFISHVTRIRGGLRCQVLQHKAIGRRIPRPAAICYRIFDGLTGVTYRYCFWTVRFPNHHRWTSKISAIDLGYWWLSFALHAVFWPTLLIMLFISGFVWLYVRDRRC